MITHVPVIGTFRYRDAMETPASGQRVVFLARNPAVVDGQVVTLPKKLTATLTAAGALPAGFTLPTVAGGLYYIVRESFSGARDDYTIQVLPTDAQIDLATVAPVVPPPELVSTRGPPGPAGPGIPDGGTAGQTLRKVDGTDGNAAWSPHWVVDPVTGAMNHTYSYANTGSAYQSFAYLRSRINYSAVGGDFYSQYTQTAGTNISNVYGPSADSAYDSSQLGYSNLQIGMKLTQTGASNTQTGSNNTQTSNYSTQSGYRNTQSGNHNTQSGYGNTQTGSNNTQSGFYNTQSGYGNTQSGYRNTQSGYGNTQTGDFGLQHGQALNDGDFDYTFMVGQTKTATVGKRAYFALDNGVWLKPVATAPTSPENGVIYYDSATHKFRGYANGVWVDLH